MNTQIYPCLRFDGMAKDAAVFYCHVFENSTITAETPGRVSFLLNEQKFIAINGDAGEKPTMATSFFTTRKNAAQVQAIWQQLIEGGTAVVPLAQYEWSELYGWVLDKYGISWQVALARPDDNRPQSFIASFMFCEQYQGRAAEAVDYYVGAFKNAAVAGVYKYPAGDVAGQVANAQFVLNGTPFIAMDSRVPQTFTFTKGISNVIECNTQEEIDHYWNALTKNGKEAASGWCQDPFGVWWQVIPAVLEKLLQNPEKAARVSDALQKMKKPDLIALENA